MIGKGDDALVTAFWPHEVLNALLAGERRRRISQDLAREFLDDISQLPVTVDSVPTAIVFEANPEALPNLWAFCLRCRLPQPGLRN